MAAGCMDGMSRHLLLGDDAAGESIVDGKGAASEGREVHDAGDDALHESGRALLTVHKNTRKHVKRMIWIGLVCVHVWLRERWRERERERDSCEGEI
jgi:hypothetical protein